MKAVEEQASVSPDELTALEQAFALFSQQTGQLRQAYVRLQEKIERTNLELEAANRELERKVRELDETGNFQRSILESIPSAVVVTDLKGVVNTFNSAAEHMWNVSRESAIGRPFGDVLGEHRVLLQGVLDGRYHGETVRRELEGDEHRVISSTACLVEDSNGRPIGAVQVDRDITRVCRLESQLNHREKLADLGKMAAGLAHEIRKPLNGIKGFASLLERGAPAEQAQQRYAGCILESADRLNGMLGRLLDFTRPDALHPVPCDLRSVAAQVVEFVRVEDPQSPVEVTVDVPDACRTVLADRNKIEQVLLNLVKNGVEAHDGPGSVVVRARPESDAEEALVVVAVEDTGRGIAADKLSKVCDPFYTEKPGGTGLGLSIVHRIVQFHGSELRIESRPSGGTIVEFALPAAPGREATC